MQRHGSMRRLWTLGSAALLVSVVQLVPAAAQSAPTPAAQAPSPVAAPSLLTVAAAANTTRDHTHHIVCTANYIPMASCSPTADPSTYSGFDIDLFRRTALIAGWDETTNVSQPDSYEFRCMPFDLMISDLTDPNGTCTVATAGVTITGEREGKGIQFTYPTLRSGLAIMVHRQESGGGWFFLRPFSWGVWLAILLTIALIPIVTLVTEFLSIEGRIERRDVGPGLKEASWRSMWTFLLLEPYHVTAIASRIVGVVYGAVATVLVNCFCANLAAALTVSQLTSSINSVNDLRGRAVGTVAVYIPRLSRYGIAATELAFEGVQMAVETWLPQLRSGMLVATVVDEPLQDYMASVSSCDLHILPDVVAPFDFGMAFHKGALESLVDKFSSAILSLQEDGTISQLRESYIKIPRPECESTIDSSTSITFQQVRGLWIILACGLALALLWLCGLLWWRARRRHAAALPHAAAPHGKQPPSHAEGSGSARSDLLHKGAGHSFQAVAFKQTVSIFGAQIGEHRREAEATAAAAAALAAGGNGSAKFDTLGLADSEDGMALAPANSPAQPAGSAAELLAHVRALCDMVEAQGLAREEAGYMDGWSRVVDDRIEETPEQGH